MGSHSVLIAETGEHTPTPACARLPLAMRAERHVAATTTRIQMIIT